MKRREKKLYRSGKRNKSGYRIQIKDKKSAAVIIAFAVVLFCSAVVSVLDFAGVFNWNNAKIMFSSVDGAVDSKADFCVYYLDVGQGDCSVIRCGDEVLMIDTGTENSYTDITSSLVTLDIETIDYLIISHQHDDHMGSAAKIMSEYTVKNIIMPRLSEENMVTTIAYEEMLQSIADNGVNPIAAEPGYEFFLGEASCRLLAPLKQDDNINNMSVITKICYKDTSFIFQGDAEKKVENSLLRNEVDLTADIIKLGHHGSNTSSTEKYLKAVNPKAAVISCGLGNSYGHPHPDVLTRLKVLGIDTYTTAELGWIEAVSDGEKITVTTQKGEEQVIYES